MLSLGWGCAPDPSAVDEASTPGVQSLAEYDGTACPKLLEAPCPAQGGGYCPPLDHNMLCVITISRGALPVSPARSCLRRKQPVKFQLAPGVNAATLKFFGPDADALFVDYDRMDIALMAGRDSKWCGMLRHKVFPGGHYFTVTTDTGAGQPGELEVVRDPGEED
ncbi:hypothetical protein [Myxococcus qinghaiensis]|uniref:hypothetical protein n=1 Tax=Myxococcus qinghaiensis TaxID=2906758 RepID=UPI0020A76900|nr:hypothetical protein [Myxococcus qinghaiensis]